MELELMQANAESAACLLKSLANPSRLLVLCALVDREYSAGELEEVAGLNQSALSQHLAKLRAEGIVIARRDGQRIYYSLADNKSARILQTLHNIYCEID